MVSPVCVACHNFRPDTPKNDWKLGDVRGILEVTLPVDIIQENASGIIYLTLFTGLLALLLVFISIYATYRYFISNKLNTINNALIDIVEGEGDLTRRLDDSGSDEISHIAQSFNRFVNNLHTTASQILQASNSLSKTSTELLDITAQTNSAIKEQKQDTELAAAEVEKFNEHSIEVTQLTEQATHSTHSAEDATNRGNIAISSTIGTVNQLTSNVSSAAQIIEQLQKDSTNIGGVLEVIQSTAEQTNLLALNAAIEAAHAGKQGRCFAVVADEVRTLAARTQDSTLEIQAMIERLQDASNKAYNAMQSNTEYSNAASIQKETSESLNQNVSQISSKSQETVMASQKTREHAQNLDELAEQLQQLIGSFKL